MCNKIKLAPKVAKEIKEEFFHPFDFIIISLIFPTSSYRDDDDDYLLEHEEATKSTINQQRREIK
jgi:hypothetical protein